MPSFSIMGDVKADIPQPEVRSEARDANPLFLGGSERESLLARKGEWAVVDGASLGKGVESSAYAEEDVSALAKFLKKNWGRKVVLICDGLAGPVAGEVCRDLQKALGCYVVSVPPRCVAGCEGCIGRYLKDALDVIAAKYDRNALDRLYLECSADLGRIPGKGDEGLRRAYWDAVAKGDKVAACSACAEAVAADGTWAAQYAERSYSEANKVCSDDSVKEAWLRRFLGAGMTWPAGALFDLLWKKNAADPNAEMLRMAREAADGGDPNAMVRIGRAYREGRGVEKDLNKAAEWMRKACSGNHGWTNELFDVLWRIGTPESYKEMNGVARSRAAEGDAGALGRIGRMYRDGRGEDKDLDKAAEWMRKAYAKNHAWANELFDVLWKMGTPEADEEMLEIIGVRASEGDSGAIVRMGRAYRDGKGVKKDVEKAAEWMRKAHAKNHSWDNELFDVLWRTGTPEAFEEMNGLIGSRASEGDPNAMGRVGRMYRDGKGEEKNLIKAAEWMRKANAKNSVWANELFDVLWNIDDPKIHKEMLSLVEGLAGKGDAGSMLRLARMYRDGKGVEKDVEKAVELLEKASQTRPDAKKELEEIRKTL